MMMDREYILDRLDEYIESEREQVKVGHCFCLRIMLNNLFDGDQAPLVEFHSLYEEAGKLVADVVPPEEEDAEEWLAALDAYLGGRLELSRVFRGTLSLSFDVDVDAIRATLRGVHGALTEAFEAYARPVRSGWIGTKAVTKKPKAKPLGKPVPPHVALYQQRGSKGKRKPW